MLLVGHKGTLLHKCCKPGMSPANHHKKRLKYIYKSLIATVIVTGYITSFYHIFHNYGGEENKVQYLQTAIAHAEAHSIHVDMIRQSCPRCLTIVLRKLLHKWRWSVHIFEDWNIKRNTLMSITDKQNASKLLRGFTMSFSFHLHLLGTLITTFSPLLWRMFLVRVLTKQIHTTYRQV